MKKFIKLFLLLFIFLVGCTNSSDNTIVTTNFPSYDFARAITKNSKIEVEMLVKPGSETHDFEPTPKDIIKIEKSKFFIYTGGESDEWVEDIISSLNTGTKVIKMVDLVDLLDEELDSIAQVDEEKETDEHVWTSLDNAVTILEKIRDEIIEIDPENRDLYEKNTLEYISKIKKLDNEMKDLVNSSSRNEIIVADRFPFLYFAKEYNLKYYAAFKGCSDATEASAKTIAFLIDKVKEDKIPVVFHIELTDAKIAKAVAAETGAKVLELHSAHNISATDFNSGITYVDIMKKNIENLKEALR